MNTPTVAQRAINATRGITRSISIGRSRNFAAVNGNTPVDIVPNSDDAPKVIGQPYLKTTFRRGRFSKTLYTPSTMRVVVGSDWSPYDNDNH